MAQCAPPSPSEAKHRYFRRNLAVNCVVDVGFGFGLGLIALGPILTVFLQSLGASNLVIGLAPALMMTSFSLPQLLGAHLTRSLRRKKGFFVALHTAAWALWVPIGLIAWRLAPDHPTAAIAALLALASLSYAFWGMSNPLWSQLMSRQFPDERRGLAFGLILASNAAGTVLGGATAALLLARHPGPYGYGLLFLLAGIVIVCTRSLHLLVHETLPAEPNGAGPLSARSLLRELWQGSRRFRRLVLTRYVFEFAGGAAAFYAVYVVTRFDLPPSAGGLLALSSSLGAVVGSPLLGRLGDRRGYRRVMGWSMVISAFALLAFSRVPDPRLIWPLFFLVGLAMYSDSGALLNFIVEMSDEHVRSYYWGAVGALMVPVRLLAPLFWGYLSGFVPLPTCFLAAMVLQLLAWGLLVGLVDDPRRPDRRILHWRRGDLPRFY